MYSRKDEIGKHQAEIKFKTEERKTGFTDGKACRQELSEAYSNGKNKAAHKRDPTHSHA